MQLEEVATEGATEVAEEKIPDRRGSVSRARGDGSGRREHISDSLVSANC